MAAQRLALCSAFACLALGLGVAPDAVLAQASPVVSPVVSPAVSQVLSPMASPGQARMFAIAPGPLYAVLNRFASVGGIDLSYDAALLGSAQSPGLNGLYTVPDGLRALLAGSGLEAVEVPGGGYALRKAQAVSGIQAAPLLPTVTIFGAAAAARGVDSSVRYVSQPGGILDAFTIRGFPVGNGNFGEIAFDGMYGVASNYRVSTGYIERIELIKGPTAMLIGMAPSGSVGGGINIVPKRATGPDLTQVTADYAASSQLGGNLDLSRRFGAQRQFGIRFNGNYRAGDTNLDNQSRHAGAGALALDYQGERLRATLDFIGQRERIAAPSRLLHIVSGINVPDAPNGRRNISQPWEHSSIRDQSLLVQAEYDIGDKLTWFIAGGGGRTRVARLFAITPTIINGAGDIAVLDSNYQFNVARTTVDTGLRARFDTGAVSHHLSLLVSDYRDQLERSFNNAATASLTNLYQPVSLPVQYIAAPASVPKVSQTRLSGVALADTLSMLDKRVQLTLGLRRQQVTSDNFSAGGAIASHYDQGAWTPMLGLVVKPSRHVTLYANRAEGLSKGDTAPGGASNAGEVFAPYKSRQLEFGVKVEQGGMMATVSAFQIAKASGQMAGTLFAANGEQRNRGLEFGLYGEMAAGVRLLASATVLDARIVRSSSPGSAGKAAVGAPTLQANLGAEWDTGFAPGLTLAGGLAYTGRQYVDQANTQSIPHWTRVDIGARYQTTVARRQTTFRLNVRNVFDKHDWAAVDAYGGLAQAEPRTLLLSATMRF
ncbi:TonB-dependent siderophore receptor [Cupriavidus sp. YAF13]|uniref:TonB-dependent siderophore receptor n=1 Tax=Cupriavidus sp. YAF13 TaxID=3233075 RepID=UPI003F9119A1